MEEEELVGIPETETPEAQQTDPKNGEEEFDFLDPAAQHPRLAAYDAFLKERGMPSFKVPKTVLDEMSEEQLQLYHGMRRSYTQGMQTLSELRKQLADEQGARGKDHRDFKAEAAKLHSSYAKSAEIPLDEMLAQLGEEPDRAEDPAAWVAWKAEERATRKTIELLSRFSQSLEQNASKSQAELQLQREEEQFAAVRAERLAWFDTAEKQHDNDTLLRVEQLFVDEFKGQVSLDRCLTIALSELAVERGDGEAAARQAAAAGTVRPSGGQRNPPKGQVVPPPPKGGDPHALLEYFRRYPQAADDNQM